MRASAPYPCPHRRFRWMVHPTLGFADTPSSNHSVTVVVAPMMRTTRRGRWWRRWRSRCHGTGRVPGWRRCPPPRPQPAALAPRFQIDHDRSCSRLIDAVREQEFRGVVGNPVRVGPGRGPVRPVDQDVPLIEPHRQHRQRPEPAERRCPVTCAGCRIRGRSPLRRWPPAAGTRTSGTGPA
jgi:hypothetical protein